VGLADIFGSPSFLLYPKSSHLQSSAVSIYLRARMPGQASVVMVQKITSLKEKKIVWPEEHFKNPETAINIITVDGVDFKTWELKHVEYVLVICVFESKLVLIDGPHRGGKHDMKIFRKPTERLSSPTEGSR
jgi:hypothetical protein